MASHPDTQPGAVPQPVRWTGLTSSPFDVLDGLEFTIDVGLSGNAHRISWSGQMPDQPNVWARRKGSDGELARRTPILIMMPKAEGRRTWQI